MASTTHTIDTGHEEMIHDAQMDYYGKRLATASSDRSIRIFDVVGEQHTLAATLSGRDGPVWQVAWAHPKFGTVLASCSYDKRVIIWKEENPGNWLKLFEDSSFDASANSISWAPHTHGLVLAAGSADGTISVYTYHDQMKNFQPQRFTAHTGGVNAVSWAPDVPSGALLSNQAFKPVKRFVSGGCDCRVVIWGFDDSRQSWEELKLFDKDDNKHGDWVRDVAWAPSVGLPTGTIATCSEDKSVIIWTEEPNGMFKKAHRLNFDHKVWRVSWSVMGNILAVSQGDNKVSLWKESLDGTWKNLTSVKDANSDEVKQNA